MAQDETSFLWRQTNALYAQSLRLGVRRKIVTNTGKIMQHVYVTDDNMVHMPGCYDVPWSIFCDWCWSELPC